MQHNNAVGELNRPVDIVNGDQHCFAKGFEFFEEVAQVKARGRVPSSKREEES